MNKTITNLIEAIRSNLNALSSEFEILRDTIENDPTVMITDPSPPDILTPLDHSYMDVGDAEGKPGDFVGVDIVGGSDVPVTGFAIAVGMGRRLQVTSVKLGDFFVDYLGTTKYFTHTTFPRGWPEPYFVAYLGFFKMPPHYKVIPSVAIPPETVLLRVTYKIPDDMPPMEQLLFNETSHFKKTDRTAETLRVRNIFTSEDLPRGINPVLSSGILTIVPNTGLGLLK